MATEDVDSYPVGTRFRVVRDTVSHGFPIGSTVILYGRASHYALFALADTEVVHPIADTKFCEDADLDLIRHDLFMGTDESTGEQYLVTVFYEGDRVVDRTIARRDHEGDRWGAPMTLALVIQ